METKDDNKENIPVFDFTNNETGSFLLEIPSGWEPLYLWDNKRTNPENASDAPPAKKMKTD